MIRNKIYLFLAGIILISLILSIGVSAYTDFPGTSKYERNENATTGSWTVSTYASNRVIAQSFTIGQTGTNENFTMKGISVYGSGAGAVCSINMTTVNASHMPTTQVAINQTWTVQELGGEGWHNVTIPDVNLTKNTEYAFIMSCSSPSFIIWQGYKSGSRSIFSLFYSDNPGNWADGYSSYTLSTYGDFRFIIWGTLNESESVEVSLLTPTDASISSTSVINFSATITSINLNLTNSTLYVWNSTNSLFLINTSNITGTSNLTSWNISSLSIGSYTWNVKACGNDTLSTTCSFGLSNFSFQIVPFEVNEILYDKYVLETANHTFTINITASSGVSKVTGSLWYNGTRDTSTIIDGTAGVYILNNTIDIPLQNSLGNKTFLWELILLFTDGSTFKQNTSLYSHQVNRTWLTLCNATYTIPYVNFTSKIAQNPFYHLNSTFKSAWEWYFGTGSIKRNYTYEDLSENNFSQQFCGSPKYLTFKVNSHIEYTASGYAPNTYYLDNASLTNSTNYINLYLLNDTEATTTILKVVDIAKQPIEGVLIQIQFYDVGTGTFYTVGMAKTDFKGEDIVYLNWYDSLYKFILIQDGEVIKITNTTKISATPVTFEIKDEFTFDLDKFKDITYSLYYNNLTNSFVLTYTKPSGLVDQACLRVTKRTSSNDSQVCLICENSSSATIYCNIGSYGNGTYIAAFYATGSYSLIKWIYKQIGETFSRTIYNLLGNKEATFYAMIFAGIVTALFFVHPVFAIVGIMLAILGGSALGFQQLHYAEFIGIVIVGGFVIWIIKK